MDQGRTTKEQERELDKAVEQTFPASDPVAPHNITGTEPPGSDPKRKAPKIKKEDIEAAAQPTEECPTCHGTGRVAVSVEGDAVRPKPEA